MEESAYLGDPQQVIRGELSPNEKLLWSGHPPRGLLFHAYDVLLIPFSLFWCGIVFAVLISAAKQPSPSIIFFTPFVLAGVWILVGRFFADAWIRARTYYGITSERIIIITGLFWRTVVSLDIRTLPVLSLVERRRGRTIVELVSNQYIYSNPNCFPGSAGYYRNRLILDEDGRKVYDLIRTAREKVA